MSLLNINKGCGTGGAGGAEGVPMFVIDTNFHQLSNETRILKIGQHLDELEKY